MNKVYVVEEPPYINSPLRAGGPAHTIDISSAAKYGELVYLFSDQDLRDAGVRRSGGKDLLVSPPVVMHLRNRLHGVRPTDYVLCIGNPAMIGVACALAAKLTGGAFNVLKWDRQQRSYVASQVEI